MKARLIPALTIFSILLYNNMLFSYADTIYLKNTRKIQGIVKTQTKESVVLDIGFGTVTFPKGDIDRIEYASPEEKDELLRTWKEKYAGGGRWVPKEAERLFADFKAVEVTRQDAINYKHQHQMLQDEIETTEKTLSDLYIEFEDRNNKLKSMTKTKNVLAYNEVVAGVNTTSARIGKLIKESKLYIQQKRNSDRILSNYISNYLEALSSFAATFNTEYAKAKEKGIKKDDEGFYKWMQEEIAALNDDIERKEIQFARGQSGIIVKAVLNGRTKALLILDTGASLVIISRKIANQLGITERPQARKIEVVLADGSTTKATPVILNSVEVGAVRADDVLAAILEEPPDPNIDGLLGMSFLSNFFVKIDSKDNKLILEKFNPK